MIKLGKIVLGIVAIILICTITPVFAAEYTFTLTVNPEMVNAKLGDTISIDIGVADIDQSTDGISALVGDVLFDEDLFESIDFVNAGNNWSTTYNKTADSENEGRFAAIQMGSVKENQVVTRLVAKVKSNTTVKTGTITLKDVQSSYGSTQTDKKTKIITVNIASSEDKDDEERDKEDKESNIIDNNTIKPEPSKKDSAPKNTTSSLPKAGIGSWIGIFLIAAIIVGIIEFIKYKRSMK